MQAVIEEVTAAIIDASEEGRGLRIDAGPAREPGWLEVRIDSDARLLEEDEWKALAGRGLSAPDDAGPWRFALARRLAYNVGAELDVRPSHGGSTVTLRMGGRADAGEDGIDRGP
jgi:hypothetical protein